MEIDEKTIEILKNIKGYLHLTFENKVYDEAIDKAIEAIKTKNEKIQSKQAMKEEIIKYTLERINENSIVCLTNPIGYHIIEETLYSVMREP